MSQAAKWVIGVIAVVVVGVLIITTGDSANNATDETGPIKVGFMAPLTGEAADAGEAVKNTTDLAIQKINANGGIDGRSIELIYEDTECSGSAGVSAARKLVNVDEVEVILGPYCSSVSLAIEPILTEAEVLMMTHSSSPELTGISKYFIRDYPSDASQGAVLAEVAYNDKGWRDVAFILEQQDYTIGIRDAFQERFEELGGSVTSEAFETGTSDFRPILTKLQSGDSDALFVATQDAPAAGRIFDQMRDLSWSPPLLLSSTVAADPAFLQENSEITDGALAAFFSFDEDGEILQELNQSYQETHGAELPYASFMPVAYDTPFLLAEGLRAVGNDGEALAEWVREFDGIEGASGRLEIAENGDRVGGNDPKVVRDGEIVDYEPSTESQ